MLILLFKGTNGGEKIDNKKILKVIWLVIVIPAILGLPFILLGVSKEVVIRAVVIAIIVVGTIVYHFRDAYKL